MEEQNSTRLRHKEWRQIAKKERRRRLRQIAARDRVANEERLRSALERDAVYIKWRADQEEQEKEKETREQKERAEREKLWLEEEIRAQKEWQIIQKQKAKEMQEKFEQQQKLREEFEVRQEILRKKKEKEKRKYEEQLQKEEELQKEINNYIDNGIKTPEALREVIDSQPGKDICPFFAKTNSCRFGDICSKNHRRFFLNKIIMIPGFYSHFSLEKNSEEYDTDIALEFEHSETQNHFREFYEDVISELESFGRIKTLRCCRNVEVHLRGNVYVEYHTEREAARAWRNLNGRWYAGKKLNCEFVNWTSWKNAICGMPKCPKGYRACNFLHPFRNPQDKYGFKSSTRWSRTLSIPRDLTSSDRRKHKKKSKWEESGRDSGGESRNWRWSESPEIELNQRVKSLKKKRFQPTEKDNQESRESSCERNRKHSKKSSAKSAMSHEKQCQPRSRKRAHTDKDSDEEVALIHRSSKKHKKESKRRNHHENGHELCRKKN